jgi:Uncharacterized protein conserved in bacteria (DUF2188)
VTKRLCHNFPVSVHLGRVRLATQEQADLTQRRVLTIRRDGVWTNEIEDEGAVSRHRTKDEASSAGRELALALRAEHVIHNMDGSVASRTAPEERGTPDSGPPRPGSRGVIPGF